VCACHFQQNNKPRFVARPVRELNHFVAFLRIQAPSEWFSNGHELVQFVLFNRKLVGQNTQRFNDIGIIFARYSRLTA
jgi:hypothetical protein